MRAFVPTPVSTVDSMLDELFGVRRPVGADRLLDPGSGDGAFIRGVIRWCGRHDCQIPNMVAVELDPGRAEGLRSEFGSIEQLTVVEADFLDVELGIFDFVVGNPPYVPITGLNEKEKVLLKERFRSATGRFDLYMLFFERAIELLSASGRLVFVTPEKFLYVDSARTLRQLMASEGLRNVRLLPEDTFAPLLTYPAVSTVDALWQTAEISVQLRDGTEVTVEVDSEGASLMPQLQGYSVQRPSEKYSPLGDHCLRVSAGVATGADGVFVRKTRQVPLELVEFAYPTISGRQLSSGDSVEAPDGGDSILVPYGVDGALISEDSLGPLGAYLGSPVVRARLEKRSCVPKKPWYAFHENPPLVDISRPKILCKDIGASPEFWIDSTGSILPRHSVYYIIPEDGNSIVALCKYLNGAEASAWLMAHCQRASNGFIRLQSKVLKRLPVPNSVFVGSDAALLASK